MPHPGTLATGALQPSLHCDQARIPGASQEGSMATPGPGWGFQLPCPATQLTALKQDFILKLLKRTEMLHMDACSWGEGSAGGGLCFFPTQDTVGEALGVSAHLSVGLCVWLKRQDSQRGQWVCFHPSAEIQAGVHGTHGRGRSGIRRFSFCIMASRPTRAGAGRVEALLQGRTAQGRFFLQPPTPLESFSPLQIKTGSLPGYDSQLHPGCLQGSGWR